MKPFITYLAAFVLAVCCSSAIYAKPMFDFDGDRKTDLSVYRPSNGTWYLLQSEHGYHARRFIQFTPAQKIVLADYDSDGKTDIAWIKDNVWYVYQSSSSTLGAHSTFGIEGDIPIPGDWDIDGKADVAVYREGKNPGEQSYFYYRGTLNNPNGNITFIPFGQYGDLPVIGDYDGDGRIDPTIFRPSVGEWWYLRSSDGANRAFQFGQNGDKPLSGDFTGDGKTDIAIFRPSTGEWFILRSEDYSYYAAPFGTAGDVPVVGDYDGDGKDDIAVWRPSDGNWYVVKSSGGFFINHFGMDGDKPIPAVYVP
ncbi:MAG TPA: VCBS repeat-containing protein [Pyrinomonadaceae bacterium]|nr:VCBS repeat-containing protein [Pyrinomonadaceae bacterium]